MEAEAALATAADLQASLGWQGSAHFCMVSCLPSFPAQPSSRPPRAACPTRPQARLGELEAGTRVSGEDAARLKALAAEIGKEEKALAELRRKSEGLAKRAEALQAQIDGAGGEKLRRQRALCDKLQEVGRGWGGSGRGWGFGVA